MGKWLLSTWSIPLGRKTAAALSNCESPRYQSPLMELPACHSSFLLLLWIKQPALEMMEFFSTRPWSRAEVVPTGDHITLGDTWEDEQAKHSGLVSTLWWVGHAGGLCTRLRRIKIQLFPCITGDGIWRSLILGRLLSRKVGSLWHVKLVKIVKLVN